MASCFTPKFLSQNSTLYCNFQFQVYMIMRSVGNNAQLSQWLISNIMIYNIITILCRFEIKCTDHVKLVGYSDQMHNL